MFALQSSAWSADIVIREERTLAYCGAINSPPFARPSDAGRRMCAAPRTRNYKPRHHGIGFEILDLESEACFVPDEAYKLLDEVIDAVKVRLSMSRRRLDRNAKIVKAISIGRITSEVLTEKGFGLYLPTDTLGDTLVSRNEFGESPRHIFDCDSASMIYLTVAEALSMPATMTEIPLPSGDQHNYVRWQHPAMECS